MPPSYPRGQATCHPRHQVSCQRSQLPAVQEGNYLSLPKPSPPTQEANYLTQASYSRGPTHSEPKLPFPDATYLPSETPSLLSKKPATSHSRGQLRRIPQSPTSYPRSQLPDPNLRSKMPNSTEPKVPMQEANYLPSETTSLVLILAIIIFLICSMLIIILKYLFVFRATPTS